MKRNLVAITLVMFVGLSITVFTVVQAQEREPSSAAETPSQCPCMKGGMRGGMMGGMRHRMMGGREPGRMGFCPMRVPGAKVDVRALDNGVTVTITAEDANAVRRIQRMAEMMRLMHEMEGEQ